MLKRLWAWWKRVGHAIGNFQARVLLTVIYAILVLPLGVAVRLLADPLRIRKLPTGWLDRPQDTTGESWARRQW